VPDDRSSGEVPASAGTLRRLAEESKASNGSLAALSAELDHRMTLVEIATDRAWLLTNGITILTMQAGFAMLEAGAVASHSTISILLKNIGDQATGSATFWLVGWGLAYGPVAEGATSTFAGTGQFALDKALEERTNFFFQFAFAATSTTILSGAVAGRLQFKYYLLVSALITGFVYPIVAHAMWAPTGWLKVMGAHDFAGCAAVHLVGGTLGLIATVTLGPRRGVFDEDGFYFPTRSSPSTAMDVRERGRGWGLERRVFHHGVTVLFLRDRLGT